MITRSSIKKLNINNMVFNDTDSEYVLSGEESCEESCESESSESESITTEKQLFTNEILNYIKKKNNEKSNEKNEKSNEKSNEKNDEKQFNKLFEEFLSGEFFQYDLDSSKIKKEHVEELIEISKNYKHDNIPTIFDILNLKVCINKKKFMLETLYNLENSELFSSEYNSNLKNLKYYLDECSIKKDPEIQLLEEQIKRKALTFDNESYKTIILKSDMSFENKVIAYQKCELMESYKSDDKIKYKNWLETLLSVPFGIYNKIPVNINKSSTIEINEYLMSIRQILDEDLAYLESPKDQILNIISRMVRKPITNINALGFYSEKGHGKTAICKSIAKALNRPLKMISLGGESDNSNLLGHNFTYIGSGPGRIVEILKETKTMSPVILFDELDKVSDTEKSKEIIATLIHLIDGTSNDKFNLDKYYSGIEFDLSNVLFIFTYNDPSKIDPILADRLYKIKINNYTIKEKLEITKKFIIKSVLNNLNMSDIIFTNDSLVYLSSLSKEPGMRTIKSHIEIILSRINTLLLTTNTDIIKFDYKKLHDYYNKNNIIKREHIDILLTDSINIQKDDYPEHMYM